MDTAVISLNEDDFFFEKYSLIKVDISFESPFVHFFILFEGKCLEMAHQNYELHISVMNFKFYFALWTGFFSLSSPVLSLQLE